MKTKNIFLVILFLTISFFWADKEADAWREETYSKNVGYISIPDVYFSTSRNGSHWNYSWDFHLSPLTMANTDYSINYRARVLKDGSEISDGDTLEIGDVITVEADGITDSDLNSSPGGEKFYTESEFRDRDIDCPGSQPAFDENYIGYYTYLNVDSYYNDIYKFLRFNVNDIDEPNIDVTGPVSESGNSWTITGGGTVTATITFPATIGSYYARAQWERDANLCYNGGAINTQNIPAKTITYTFTATAAPTCNFTFNGNSNTTVTSPTTVTQAWSSTDATSFSYNCTTTGTLNSSHSGSGSLSLNGTNNFNLNSSEYGVKDCNFSVNGPGGSNTCSATLTVNDGGTMASCGPNATTYSSSTTNYPGTADTDFCSIGNAPSPDPAFPAAGGFVTWVCQGLSGGADRNCTAIRNNGSSSNNCPIAEIDTPSSETISIDSGDSVSFSGHGIDTGGSITNYEWRAGDCSSGVLWSTADSFSRTFSSAGTYYVYFRVQDNDGCWSDCDSVRVIVNPTASYSCQGGIPQHASAYDSEESSGVSNTTTFWNYADYDTSTKCQYHCNSGYKWDGWYCVLGPDVEITATPEIVDETQTSVISWTVSNANNCSVRSNSNSNGYGWHLNDVKSASGGSEIVGPYPTGDYRFRLYCEDTYSGFSDIDETYLRVNPPIDGVCGEAAKEYSLFLSGYSGDFCDEGTVNPASPAFPDPGNSVNWTCSGENGGTDGICIASRCQHNSYACQTASEPDCDASGCSTIATGNSLCYEIDTCGNVNSAAESNCNGGSGCPDPTEVCDPCPGAFEPWKEVHP